MGCHVISFLQRHMIVLWLPIYHKIEGNYFKGKTRVLYKLKTKTSGKGYEIIVLLITVTTLTSDIFTYPRNSKCQFDVKHASLSMHVAPKISN